ncbi:MAG TPA: M14 family metallopeptidase [Hyphomonadaceae bacterium]|nr:M14 family metallopeptidase [Hyphomonadaceae bacterium]
MIVHRQVVSAIGCAAFFLIAGTSIMADAQSPTSRSGKLDPESFLPPAPQWSGASEKLIVPANDKWITPSETTGITASPTYDETVAFLKKIDKASSLVRLETFGTTPQGRKLVAAVVTKDGAQLNADKPVFLIQAGIHSGEIDGKDAALMLIRDICFKGRDALIDKVNIIFVPVFNADGHERSQPYNRPNQRGPINMGWRNTAQNLNLNRDYMKADAPEMQAMLGLMRKYDPDFYIDLHVTDGMDYQYDITYGFDGWDGLYADSPSIGKWLNDVYRPQADAALKANGHIPGPLIFMRDESDVSKGTDLNAFAPRFSHGYGDLRRLPTVLVENHSLKPYRQRVLGTYVLLEATLKALANDGKGLKTAIAADRALRPSKIDANWKTKEQPVGSLDFLTIEATQAPSPVSGGQTTRWNGKPGPAVKIPVYGSEPGFQLSVPKAYWVPATKPDVIARLKAHGVAMETIKKAQTVEVDMIRLTGFRALAPSEGRTPVTANGLKHETRKETFPPGSVRVSTDQPLGALAAYLLEPESEDSFFAWGFFTEILQRVEYMEPYAIAPMAERMLEDDPQLKAEFEKRLKDDSAFAASPLRRLQFFYERSPFYDDRYLLYPVGREP